MTGVGAIGVPPPRPASGDGPAPAAEGDAGLGSYLGPELLGLLGDAVTVIGPDWRYRYVSPAAAVIIGRTTAECVGSHVWDLFPAVVGTAQYAVMERAMSQRTRERFVWSFDTADRWYEQHALPVADGLVVYVLDITDRMSEVSRAEHLAQAGEALAGAVTLEDVNEVLRVHVHHLVGALAGSIILADDERSLMRALGWAGGVSGWDQFAADAPTPSTTAHRTGEPVFVRDREDATVRFPLIAAELERLGCGPVASLPLVSAGVRLGAWALLFPEDRLLDEGDRRFLVTAAAMVSQALLRARLLDVERRAMAQLQRSLLPRNLQSVPGLDIAVRYAAGDAAVEVGGDWYDVVPLEGGAVGLVMGDVEGHDVEAAACMGLVRSAVRAYAAEGHPPSIVLKLANQFVSDVGLGRLVTLTYFSVHPLERLIIAVSAGHLPLQVVAPDGTHVEVPSDVGPPLGVFASGALWSETTSQLPAEGVLVAFTDGLVETRDEDIDVGLARVRETLIASRAGSADAVADALLDQRSRSSGDDVALLVGRLTAPPGEDRRFTRRMPPTSASVFLARRSTRQLLAAWDVDAETVQTAELVVSELMSNAARQSEDPVDIVLLLGPAAVRIEVADTSHRMPVLQHGEVDADATSGRGLLLVQELADRWGVDQSDGLGKLVWAELDLTS
ncbi:MAG: hypothetical protein JWN88_2024 [Frankiales bacterium]|jgi:serine phosphatase RsbU (regulator of sigma subunit)/anti-sigma regulatory factor (Ser/Thr protein kinase)|nr:hypothetical protein [Frankiales bacterium]